MVLILTQTGDSHSDLVERALLSRSIPVVRLNTEAGIDVASLIADGERRLTVRAAGKYVDLAAVRTVWCRRAFPPDSVLAANSAARVAIRRSVETLAAALRDRFWINPYWADQAAHCKPYQLQVALNAGLAVPSTLVTNNPDGLAAFANGHQKVVFKTAEPHTRSHPSGQTVGIYTSRVTLPLSIQRLKAVRLSPCIFQEAVQKVYDIRVTVIGHRMFAATIQSPSGALDVRRDAAAAEYASTDLSDDVRQAVLSYMNRLGLVFGCLDFVLSSRGGWEFLEVNPRGQWYWIEQKTSLPLLNTLVEMMRVGRPDF